MYYNNPSLFVGILRPKEETAVDVYTLLNLIPNEPILFVSPETRVIKALRMMRDNHLECVVVGSEEKPAGIMTTTDYWTKVELKGKTAKDTTVAEIMTPADAKLQTVSLQTSFAECLAKTLNHHVRHLFVMDKGKVVRILTMWNLALGIFNFETGQQMAREQFYHPT